MRTYLALSLGMASALLSTLALASTTEFGQSGEPLLYDGDTRQELIACVNPGVRKAAVAVVSLIRRAHLRQVEGRIDWDAPTLADELAFCSEPRFATQPVLADCSGVLVGDDLVLTAGHCVDSQVQCDDTLFVFGFQLDDRGQVELKPEDIYECDELLGRDVTNPGLPVLYDYAVVRLAQSVPRAIRPATVRLSPAVPGERVYLVGNGLGLPTKVDAAGEVLSGRSSTNDYFLAHIDNFQRGSGSPVFDSAGSLLGVAVRGGVDFDGSATCLELRDLDAGTSLAEEVTYAWTSLIATVPDAFAWSTVDAGARPDVAHDATFLESGCAASRDRGSAGHGLSATLLALAAHGRRRVTVKKKSQNNQL